MSGLLVTQLAKNGALPAAEVIVVNDGSSDRYSFERSPKKAQLSSRPLQLKAMAQPSKRGHGHAEQGHDMGRCPKKGSQASLVRGMANAFYNALPVGMTGTGAGLTSGFRGCASG
ncbi:hypothetical protein FQR65_LT20526 [Abscondita terminalis]|nr:hypothetical protein FQR65_LT20526 [Abscondita terminalis]